MITFEYFDVENTRAYEAYVDIHNRIVPDERTSVWFEQRMDRLWNPKYLKKKVLIKEYGGSRFSGAVVGWAVYGEPSWAYSPQKYFGYGEVDKPFRGRGIGTAMYEWLLDEVTPFDPVSLEIATGENRPAGIRFLENRGFQLMTREPRSILDPATFDPEPFLDSMGRVAAIGVELLTLNEFRRRFPETWLRKLYELEIEIDKDIPWHDEITPRSFEIFSSHFEDNRTLLPEGYFIAVDNDESVGMSMVMASSATDEKLHVGTTGVVRSHRRKGIATALKVKTALYAGTLRAVSGRTPVIETGNEENNPMLQLNLRLGFREHGAWRAYKKWFKAEPMTAESGDAA